ERSIMSDTIADLDPRTPLVVDQAATVRSVLNTLVENSVGTVLIAKDGVLVGIFSEKDALRRLNVDAAAHADEPISKFMTNSPETLESNASIAFAVHRMDQGGFRHVPIVSENGTPEGIISVRDILRFLNEKLHSGAK
ncbi:MAG: CBS domain-containing protein, partial [Pirellulaceae bacterium]